MIKRLLKIFSKESSIRHASIVLVITTTLSNVLGLVRDRFLTKNIDTFHLDIYYAAFRIPDFIFNVVIFGAITSAFIPIFSDYWSANKKKEGFYVANLLINLSLVITILLAVIGLIFMPSILPLVAKFSADRMPEAIKYSRLLMLLPIFFSLSYIVGGMLNAMKRFIAYSLAPLFYNLAIIIGAAVMAPRYGLIGVIYFVIAGSFLHFLIQYISALALGYRYQTVFSLTAKPIKKIIRLMVPRTISMGSAQILLLAFTRIASVLAAGSISAFNLATNIVTMPVVVLGTSFATAVFPTLADKISQNNKEEFAFYLNRSIRAIGYLLLPSSVIFILLRAQIVRLILGSGKFNWEDTKVTALTLGFFSVSILAQGLVPLLSKAFYALKNSRTPMWISIYTVVLTILLAIPLSKSMGVSGLAFAFSIGNFFNLFVLFFYLHKQYPGIFDRQVVYSYLKTFFASAIMGLVIWFSMHFLADHVNMDRFWGVFVQASSAIVIGVIVFLILSYYFDSEELRWAFTRKVNGE